MVSRAQVAANLAGRLGGAGRGEAVREAAAWLVTTGRARQARYLARDVAARLADDGYVVAEVTSAHELDEAGRTGVTDYVKTQTGAKEVEIDITVEQSVIGGVRMATPTATLDATVQNKLARYVEGATN